MSDPETAALLRTVPDELRAAEPGLAANREPGVAITLLQAAKQGRPPIDDAKPSARKNLRQTPTMWR